MTDKSLRVTDYLGHILEAIERIREYTRDLSEDDFHSNSLVQDAVIRNFEIMGEASRNIQQHGKDLPELRNHLQIFREVYSMRNALAHGYFDVNLTIHWNAVRDDLEKLEQQIEDLYVRLRR